MSPTPWQVKNFSGNDDDSDGGQRAQSALEGKRVIIGNNNNSQTDKILTVYGKDPDNESHDGNGSVGRKIDYSRLPHPSNHGMYSTQMKFLARKKPIDFFNPTPSVIYTGRESKQERESSE